MPRKKNTKAKAQAEADTEAETVQGDQPPHVFQVIDTCSVCDQCFVENEDHACRAKEASANPSAKRSDKQMLAGYNLGIRNGLACCPPCQKVYTMSNGHAHKLPHKDKRTQTVRCGLFSALRPQYRAEVIPALDLLARRNQEACILGTRLANLTIVKALNAGQSISVNKEFVKQCLSQVCHENLSKFNRRLQESESDKRKREAANLKAREKTEARKQEKKERYDAQMQQLDVEAKKKQAQEALQATFQDHYLPSIQASWQNCAPSLETLASTAHQNTARTLVTSFENMHQMTAFAKHRSWARFELLRTLGWAGQMHIDRA